MLRRDLLKLVALFPSMAVWPSIATAQDTKPPRFIDTHCHVFNAHDLPIEKFVEKVMLPDLLNNLRRKGTSKFLVKLFNSHAKAEGAFIALLAAIMRESTPDTVSEKAEIARFGTTLTQDDLRLRRNDKEVEILTRILRLIWEPTPGHQYFIPIVLNEVRAQIRREATSLAYPQDAYADPQTDIDALGLIAGNLYFDEGPNRDRPIGYMMRWALRFGRNRFELVDELSNMYSGRAKLLTPALVDFDFWLDEPNWESDKAKREFQLQQIDIMAAIARRPKGPRTHGFMCFDPLRHAFFVQRKKAGLAVGLSPLEIVQRAIDNGFIGVKLYPPMGFRPFNNDHIPLPSYVTDRERGLGSDAGIAIDAALYELYAWCESKQVPIMAHANDSNESHLGYAARASPDNWRKLIESNRFLNLRINLGHFGGFEEYFYNPIGPEKKIEETWEWKVLQIWKTFPQALLFADISYFNEILALKFEADEPSKDANLETRKQVTEFWREYVKPSALSATRLMYGSDWIMIGGETGLPSFRPWNPQPEKFYPDIVAEFLGEVKYKDFEIDQILFKNAVEFLGLGSAHRDGTRGRLETFHASTNADWLTVFD